MRDMARIIIRIALVMAAALIAPACGVSHMMSGLGSGIFGSREEQPEGWQTAVTEESLLAAAKADTGDAMDIEAISGGCPPLRVWPADRHLTVYEIGHVGDSMAVVHRGSITKTARECSLTEDGIVIKYGFAGRVLMGPKGQDGTVTLPVKIHVTDTSGTKLKTETINVQVKLTREKPVAYFSVVRKIGFERAPGVPAQSYRVFLAFDRTIPGAG